MGCKSVMVQWCKRYNGTFELIQWNIRTRVTIGTQGTMGSRGTMVQRVH